MFFLESSSNNPNIHSIKAFYLIRSPSTLSSRCCHCLYSTPLFGDVQSWPPSLLQTAATALRKRSFDSHQQSVRTFFPWCSASIHRQDSETPGNSHEHKDNWDHPQPVHMLRPSLRNNRVALSDSHDEHEEPATRYLLCPGVTNHTISRWLYAELQTGMEEEQSTQDRLHTRIIVTDITSLSCGLWNIYEH